MEETKQKKRLLWVGDAACPSGFAVATHQILEALRQEYEIVVLGINYFGDPHSYEYPIYAASIGGDPFGVGRLTWMCHHIQPDVIVFQNDGWNIPAYVGKLQQRKPNGEFVFPKFANIPLVAVLAVDGKNFDATWLAGINLAIFWTQFALDEARAGGYSGPAKVIPLGVNLGTYHPLDRQATRREMLGQIIGDRPDFIVGNVNRNQPRKRFDLMVKYFSKWITDYDIRDAWLYVHAAPTGDMCVDLQNISRYYDCLDRVINLQPPAFYGVTEDQMCKTYNCFDVTISTTQGEGWGLPAIESMACGVPCLLPDWSAYGEWARDAAVLVPCSSTRVDFPYVNVIGGVVDEEPFVRELNRLYEDHNWRMSVAAAGQRRANEERFRWRNIGAQYLDAVNNLMQLYNRETKMDLAPVPKTQEELETIREQLIERRHKILRGEITV